MRRYFFLFALILLITYSSSYGQEICNCSKYDSVFQRYRTARDAGNNSYAGEIAATLSSDKIQFCRALGINLLANVALNDSRMEDGFALINNEKVLLDSLACGENAYLEYYLTKSFYHYSQDEYDSSIANSIKALRIAERTNALTRQITLRLGIGSAFYRIGQQEKKMEYARGIIPLIEKIDDQSFKCQYYFNLFGAYYTYYGQVKKEKIYLDSASLFNDKALQIAKATVNRRFLPYCYEALEIINHERGGSPAKGIRYIDSAIYYGRSSMNNSQMSELLLNKASLYASLGKKGEAYQFADSGLYYSAKHPQKSVHASHLIDASDLLTTLGDHQRALTLHREADVILDSIKSVENARTVRELEEKYNKEKNEKTISQLSQEKQISQLQIRVLVLAIVVALAVIALIVFLSRLRLARQQQQVLDTKQRLSQALINPHFLSNALVSIQRFMMENNTSQAANYLTKFSRLMRQLLEYSREELITIEEEIDLLRNYLDIQKLRLKDKFEYEIRVDGNLSVSELRIPPMFAQPFVENAIEHGVSNSDKGKIEIAFTKKGEQLVLEVIDNGKGISQGQSDDHKSLSSKIIRERIALLNKSGKNQIQLQIESNSVGSGTHVQLTLPIYS